MAAKKPAKKRMGRPPVPEDQRLEVKLMLRVTESDWELLEAAAAERGVTPAEVIRQCVRAQLAPSSKK